MTLTPEMSTTIQTIVLSVVLPSIAAILALVAKYVMKWLEIKTSKLESEKIKIEEERKQAATEFGLKRLDHVVTNVVAEAAQVKPSGVLLTPEDNAIRLSNVQAEIKSQVKPEIMAAVATVVQDPERYITTKIEAAVGDLKSKSADCK